MNKRIRKKKRMGEFREMGVEIFGYWAKPQLDAAEYEVFIDALIAYADANHLSFGGGGLAPFTFIISHRERGSVTDAQVAELVALFRASPLVKCAEAGPLIDMWHVSEARMERIEREVLARLVS